jgi:UDP-2,4-diacetamido-2,4,6-trideoxy-beta-L-altropyranose hydrolase
MFITFRTDASTEIGTGHVMRCLSLASKLRSRGAICRFICRNHPGNLIEFIREHDFETIELPLDEVDSSISPKIDAQSLDHAAWLGVDWRIDADQTIAGFGNVAVDWLIVDHYALDSRWESVMRGRCKRIMVIDDIADRNHDCDLLLDQNLFAEKAARYIGKIPVRCSQLLGPKYALLQSHYAELHARIPPRQGPVRRILVYFGGVDANNLTSLAVTAYRSIDREDIALDVVVNATNPHVESLRQQIEGDNNVILHVGLPSLAPLMAQADLAIGAGGATSWERCCMGLPTLVISIAANQVPIAHELDRQGFIRWLGDVKEISGPRLLEAVKDLCRVGLPPEWSKRCRHLVDGQGAERVASILMLSDTVSLKARLARVDDEELLLGWANDSLIRKNGFVSKQIDRSNHHKWFCDRLRDLNGCQLFVIETEENIPIGQVRFYLLDTRWEIDYAVDEGVSGFSLDELILSAAMDALRDNISGPLLFRGVQTINQESDEVFERLGLQSDYSNRREERLSIAVCSGVSSWINPYLPNMLVTWLRGGHSVGWAHNANTLPKGDICFYLSYGSIVDASTLTRFKNNLVVHESDLPKGRGWSPMTYLILEGEKRIPVTLLEAADQVDTGAIYLQDWINLRGNELGVEWRQLQSDATLRVCQNFVSDYPNILGKARQQVGESFFYPRRRPSDSELDPHKTISEQFSLFRVADNESYPVFFVLMGKKFILQVESCETNGSYE